MGKTDDKKQEKVVDKIKKLQFYNKWWFWVTVIAVPAVIICVIVVAKINSNGAMKWKEIESSVNESSETQVGDGKISVWKMTRPYMEYGKFYQPSDGGEYIAFTVSIENTGKNAFEYYRSDFKLIDSSGNYIYPEYLGDNDQYLDSGVVYPNKTVGGLVVFEVDKYAKNSSYTLEYDNIDNETKVTYQF